MARAERRRASKASDRARAREIHKNLTAGYSRELRRNPVTGRVSEWGFLRPDNPLDAIERGVQRFGNHISHSDDFT